MVFCSPVPFTDDRKIKIGIDGRMLAGARRGDGRYVFELCRELDRFFRNAEFYIYCPVKVEMPVVSDRWILRHDKSPFSWLSPLLWLKTRGSFLCRKDKLDVFWATNVFLPMLAKNVKKIVTVHDFKFLIAPETLNRIYLCSSLLFFIKDLRKADILIANSVGTAGNIKKYTGLSAAANIRPAVRQIFKPQSCGQIRKCLTKLGVNGPYLLNVATWDPVKNLEILVRTFIGMKKQGLIPDYKLVLVGKRGWNDQIMRNLIRSSKTDDVIAPGYLKDEYLPPLYSGADLFVFPSINEGFGMPVLEARACGTRVVATDLPELREAGGHDTIYIKPTISGLRQGILDGLKYSHSLQSSIVYDDWDNGGLALAKALSGLI